MKCYYYRRTIRRWYSVLSLVFFIIPPPILWMEPVTLCFLVVRLYVRACSGGGILRPSCRRLLDISLYRVCGLVFFCCGPRARYWNNLNLTELNWNASVAGKHLTVEASELRVPWTLYLLCASVKWPGKMLTLKENTKACMITELFRGENVQWRKQESIRLASTDWLTYRTRYAA